MTVVEAVGILKENKEQRTVIGYLRIKDMAISSLEKQIPKKLIEYSEADMEFIHYECPNCKNILHQHYKNARENRKANRTEKYCVNCGQALDWSD